MSVAACDLLNKLHELGSRITRTPVESQMLEVIEDTIASFTQGPVHLPWRPPADCFERLAARSHTAAAWAAAERLWFFFGVEGLIADPLRTKPSKRRRAVDFDPVRWVAAAQAAKCARRLFELPGVPWASAEERYVAEAVYLLSCALSPFSLLWGLIHVRQSDVWWQQGVLWLARSAGAGRVRDRVPYSLDLPAHLAMGRLELYCRLHPEVRSQSEVEWLPERWRQQGALAQLLTRWLQACGGAEGIRDHLVAVRCLPFLHQPALFAAVRSGFPAGWQGDPASSPPESRPGAEGGISPLTGAPGPRHEPAALGQIRWHLRRIRRRMSASERERIANAFEVLLPELQMVESPLCNDALVTEWAVALLRNTRLSPNTVLTRLTGLYTTLNESLATSILTLSSEELHELFSELIAKAHTANSRQVMKQRLKQFWAFLRTRYGLSAVKWQAVARGTGKIATAITLVDPYEAEQAVPLLSQRRPAEARALSVAIILAFWCGLRAAELAELWIEDFLGGLWGLIRIRDSKTAASVRTVPGALLIPREIWALVEAYIEDRRRTAGTGQASLLITAAGAAWTAKAMGKRISAALRRATKRTVSLHALRRGFATYTLIAWGVARGFARWPTVRSGWQEAAIAPARMAGLLEALGTDESLVIPRLSRLLGHAGSEVTLMDYVAVDVVQQAWAVELESSALPASVAADLLQISRIALYKRLQPIARGSFDAQAVLEAQLSRIKRCREATTSNSKQSTQCSSNSGRPRASDAPAR